MFNHYYIIYKLQHFSFHTHTHTVINMYLARCYAQCKLYNIVFIYVCAYHRISNYEYSLNKISHTTLLCQEEIATCVCIFGNST